MIIYEGKSLKSFADESYFGISNTSDDDSLTLESSCLTPSADPEIFVDYTPETSLDLGIQRNVNMNKQLHTTNENLSRLHGEISGHRSRRLIDENDRSNPHDELLSIHYDRKRIESMLDEVYPCENDSVESFGRSPLHEIIDDFSVEAQIKENIDAEDNWTSYQRYHSVDISNRVSTPKEDRIDAKDVKEPILHDSEQLRTFLNDDDDRSINNAIATKNFVSAPRLLEATKSVPSVVQVRRPNNDKSSTSMKYVSTARFKAIGDYSVSRPRDASYEITSVSSCGFNNKFIVDDKSRISSSYCSTSTPWSRNSPVGVDHFDERRPWRKSKSRLYTAVKPNYEENFIHDNEEVIARLKSQVGNIISENSLQKRLSCNLFQDLVHPRNIIGSDLAKINSIKARRREIEIQRVPSSSSRCTSSMSKRAEKERPCNDLTIQELKTRLRRIESTKTIMV